MKKTGIVLALAALTSTSVFADDYVSDKKSYFEISYSQYNESDDELDQDLSISTLIGAVGYNFSKYFAIEGFLGFGLADDSGALSINGNDVDYEAGIGNMVGVNLKGSLNFTDNLSGFAKFGLMRWNTEVTVSALGNSMSVSGSDSGTVIGGGLQYDFTSKMYGTTSYTKVTDSGGFVNLGLGFKF